MGPNRTVRCVLEHLPASASTDTVVGVLRRDGVVVVDELVPSRVMDRLAVELEPFLTATPVGSDPFAGTRTRRTGGLIARSATARELITHPLVLQAVRGVLSQHTSIQLHLTQVIAIEPGQGMQHIHRDQWAFDFFPFPRGYEVTCNTIWALTDFTERNGATRVIAGSNALDDGLTFSEADTEPAEMQRGSVLLYAGSLYHGGGANRSEDVRRGVNLTYAAAWLRQEENQYLSVPAEIARELPDDLLRLMGYARGAYALGYVDDLRDPLEVLRGPSAAAEVGFGVDPTQ
jgi:ectoine hydroxylase-related dioxygenase (phytanoyl-CoA dioxygenase family)